MIQGFLFDGHTSNSQKVTLHCDEEGQVSVEGGDLAALHFSDLKISPRIGQTPRYITFPDGSQFESEDNDAIDALLIRWQPSGSIIHRTLHRLESHWRTVSLSLLLLICFAWGLVQYGIPYFSRELALAAPAQISQLLGDAVEKSMERIWEEESTLDKHTQHDLESLFYSLVPNDDTEWRLLFRQGGMLGANAFALPNGTIVMTDELVEIAHNQDQLMSIMAHEIGHVLERHGLRTLIQQSSLAILLVLVTGDVSASSSLITALPAVLVEAGYSQHMEREADTYALDYLRHENIDPIVFAEMMHLLEHHQYVEPCPSNSHTSDPTDQSGEQSKCIESNNHQLDLDTAPDATPNAIGNYFSTHPSTQERIERFRQASSQMNKQ